MSRRAASVQTVATRNAVATALEELISEAGLAGGTV